jgi:hypothetical protein
VLFNPTPILIAATTTYSYCYTNQKEYEKIVVEEEEEEVVVVVLKRFDDSPLRSVRSAMLFRGKRGYVLLLYSVVPRSVWNKRNDRPCLIIREIDWMNETKRKRRKSNLFIL